MVVVALTKAVSEVPTKLASHLKVFPWMLSDTKEIVYVKMVD